MPDLVINGRFLSQPLTGIQRYAQEVVLAWDEMLGTGEIDPQRYRFRLFAPSATLHSLPLKNIEVITGGGSGSHLWEQTYLPRQTCGAALINLGLTAPLWHLWRGDFTSVTLHSLAYHYMPTSYSRTFRWVYALLMPPIIRSADRLFTVSENEKKQILHVFPQAAHRLKVIYPGVRSTSPSPDFPALPKRFLLFVGSLNPLKNLTLLLQALPLLSAVKDLHVVIVGATSPVFGTVGLTLDESWRERCHFLGQINQPEVLSAIYQQAEALVFPSRYESFGLPCLEAMQLGCPVLASDLPVLRETCGDAAWFFSPDNPTSLAQAIQRLLLESNARTELIGRGRQHSAQFSWSRCARALWSEIKTSLDTRSATAP